VLIYNHNKQLVGIDDETLANLGYKTLGEFFKDHKDVAQLFVKKPGYIHNFQNFPWIDFVLHADAEDTKAMIQTEKKLFSCNINITPIYLTDEPEREGYLVHLKHVKFLEGAPSQFERETFAEPEPAPFAKPAKLPEPEFETPIFPEPTVEQSILQEPDTFDIPEIPVMDLPDLNPDGSIFETETAPEEPFDYSAFDNEAFGHETFEQETFEHEAFEDDTFKPEPLAPKPIPETPKKGEKPMLGDYINQEEMAYLDNLQVSSDYVYDPQIAAEELGLPVELIEEFIGDFIQQAHDFKNDLFEASLHEDYDEVHVLSHKLKGVAANLRIEDAFEVLSIVNGSRDHVEIEANLKQFYRIIAKMEGKEVPDFTELEAEAAPQAPLDSSKDDDIYDFGMLLNTEPEEETVSLKESPYKMPELKTEASVPYEEKAAEPEETVEPFDLGIIPEEEHHLIHDAAEAEQYKQISGDIGADNELALNMSAEPLNYDIKKAAAEIGLKETFIRSLIGDFVSDAQAKRAELMQAITAQDMKKIKAIAFEFKGLSDNLRILQISDTLTKLLRNENPAAVKTEAERFYALLKQL